MHYFTSKAPQIISMMHIITSRSLTGRNMDMTVIQPKRSISIPIFLQLLSDFRLFLGGQVLQPCLFITIHPGYNMNMPLTLCMHYNI